MLLYQLHHLRCNTSKPGRKYGRLAYDVSNVFLEIEISLFWIEFRWMLFLSIQFMISRHCVRRWPSYPTHICVTRLYIVFQVMETTATMNNIWKVRKEVKQKTSQALAMRLQPPVADSEVISFAITSLHSRVVWIFGMPLCCFIIFRICELSGVGSGSTLLPLCLISWSSLIETIFVFLPHLVIAIKHAGIGRSPGAWYIFRINICITNENAQTHTSTVMYVPAKWSQLKVFL